MRNADGWSWAFIAVGTAAIVTLLPEPNGAAQAQIDDHMVLAAAPSLSTVMPMGVAGFKIVITGHRRPAECRDIASDSNPQLASVCAQLEQRVAMEQIVPVDARGETIQFAAPQPVNAPLSIGQ